MDGLVKEIECFLFKNAKEINKIWIYKGKVIVLDAKINDYLIAFDITPDFIMNTIRVELFCRNKPESLMAFEKKVISFSKSKYLIFQGEITKVEKMLDIISKYMGEIKILEPNKSVPLINKSNELIKIKNIPNSIKYNFTIIDVLKRDMCIGCGACSIITNRKIDIKRNSYGIYEATLEDIEELDEESFNIANSICPFSNMALNENQLDIPNNIYKFLPYDEKIGRYDIIIAAKKQNEEELLECSSGGMTSWLIKKLFEENKIDAVVHVGQGNNESLFEYKISYSLEDAEKNKKSAYYSITLTDILEDVRKQNNLRYAIVGLPCMIKATRLLAQKDKNIKNSILYYLGLVCGHLKSSFFAEANAWQCGVNPQDIDSVDFRVKNRSNPANRYDFSAVSKTTAKTFTKKSSSLVGGSWAYGGFQPNACNYCDDVFSETADIVFADAWLNEYMQDWSGTNLVVSRNQELSSFFNVGLEKNEIKVVNLTVIDAIKSQAGGLRHRKDGLKIRLYNDLKNGLKIPRKRVEPSIKDMPEYRVELIKQRQKISNLSLEYFKEAKQNNNLILFLKKIQSELELYKHINTLNYPKVEKQKFYDIALFGWHYNRNLGGSLTVFALHQFLENNGFNVAIVPKPGSHKVTDGNKANCGIVDKYYKYAKNRPFEKLHELRNYCDTFVLASDQLWAGKWIAFKPEFEFLACGDKSVKK